MIDTNALTGLISALRAETERDSISPENVGYILQQIVNLFPDLDLRVTTLEEPFVDKSLSPAEWVDYVGRKLDGLASKLYYWSIVASSGFFYTDAAGYVAFKYTPSDGLDAAKVSEHFKGLVGAGANSNVEAITEQGFYYTDAVGNVAFKYTPSDGLDAAKVSSHLKSLLDTYENLTETTYNI